MAALGLGSVEVLGGSQIPRLGRVVDVGLIWIAATGIAGGRIVFVGHLAVSVNGGSRGKKDSSPELKAMRTWIMYQQSFGILGDF